MKKKTLTTVISIITILFIFSSISYAVIPAEWVNAHNSRRYWHGGPNVTWDYGLAEKAQSWANTGIWKHSVRCSQYRDCDVGENMFKQLGVTPTAEKVVSKWYSEEPAYVTYVGYGNEPQTGIVNGKITVTDPNFYKYGHFAQVVWKGSTKIGCGYNSSCGHVVCQYKTGGNYPNEFKQNVRYNFWPIFKAWLDYMAKIKIIHY